MASEQIGSASIRLEVDTGTVEADLRSMQAAVETVTKETAQTAQRNLEQIGADLRGQLDPQALAFNKLQTTLNEISDAYDRAVQSGETSARASQKRTEAARAAQEIYRQEVEKLNAVQAAAADSAGAIGSIGDASRSASSESSSLIDTIVSGFTGARGAVTGVVRVLGTFGAAVGVLTLVRDAIDKITDSSGRAARAAAEAQNRLIQIIPDNSFERNLERFDDATAKVLKTYADLKRQIQDVAQEEARRGTISQDEANRSASRQIQALNDWRDRELAANESARAERNVAEQQRASAALAELASQYAKERMSDEERINAEYDDRIRLIQQEAEALARAGGLPEYVQALRDRASAEAESVRRSQLGRIEAEKKARAEQESARAMEAQTRESERRAQVESNARAQAQRDQAMTDAMNRQAFALSQLLQEIRFQTEVLKNTRRVL